MKFRLLPSRLYTQPQGAVEVDPSSPFSKDIAFAFYGQPWDPVTEKAPSAYVGSFIASEVGTSFSSTSSAQRLVFTLSPIAGTSGLTMMLAQRCNASNTTTKRAITLADGSGNTGFYVNHANGTTNVMYGGSVSTTGSFGIKRSTSAPSSNTRFNTALTHSGGVGAQPSFYINGVEQTTVDSTGSGTRRATTQVIIGNLAAATTTFNGDIPWAFVWSRVLSTDEQAELFRNPWQLFRAPIRRIYKIPAAGTTYSISGDVRDEAFTTGTIGRETPVLGTTTDEAAVAGTIARSTPVVGDVLDDGAVAGSLGRSTAVRGDDLDDAYATGDVTVGGAQSVDVTAGVVANAYCTGSLGVTPYFPWAIRVAPGMRTTRAVKLRGTPR